MGCSRVVAVCVVSIVAALLLTGWRPAQGTSTPANPGGTNPIVVENARPGTNAWHMGAPGFRVADDREQQIKGYAGATSVNVTEAITFYVSVSPAQNYQIDVFRMGWYGGQGGRLMQHIGPLAGVEQTPCPVDRVTGMVACSWNPGYTLTVPPDWTSGVYIALLTNDHRYQNLIMFVVRDDARRAALLVQQPVLTYQAYNNYPDDGRTGKSLYGFNSYGANTVVGRPDAVQVSFDRPYSNGGTGLFFSWDADFVDWVERMGYDVSYATDLDTHERPGMLLNHRAFVSIGHNEYWSRAMYDAVEKARDAGVNLGFFGANNIMWQVRLQPSAAGIPDRVVVCYRNPDVDPEPDSRLKTTEWRLGPLNRPEQALIGVQFVAAVLHSINSPFVVQNSSHWVYTGTGLHDGDVLSSVVGYEVDRLFTNYPAAPGRGYTILSASPIRNDENGQRDISNASIYQAPSGAWVFATGAMSWSWGLSRPGYVNPSIQKITVNVLNTFVTGVPPGGGI